MQEYATSDPPLYTKGRGMYCSVYMGKVHIKLKISLAAFLVVAHGVAAAGFSFVVLNHMSDANIIVNKRH